MTFAKAMPISPGAERVAEEAPPQALRRRNQTPRRLGREATTQLQTGEIIRRPAHHKGLQLTQPSIGISTGNIAHANQGAPRPATGLTNNFGDSGANHPQTGSGR